jgi:hypothetical protein
MPYEFDLLDLLPSPNFVIQDNRPDLLMQLPKILLFLRHLSHSNQFINHPNVIRDSSRHCWCDPQ